MIFLTVKFLFSIFFPLLFYLTASSTKLQLGYLKQELSLFNLSSSPFFYHVTGGDGQTKPIFNTVTVRCNVKFLNRNRNISCNVWVPPSMKSDVTPLIPHENSIANRKNVPEKFGNADRNRLWCVLVSIPKCVNGSQCVHFCVLCYQLFVQELLENTCDTIKSLSPFSFLTFEINTLNSK